ncbi:hypothetical protein [Streptomyces sp. Tu 3180]|uniref:hypothetical protein n=1 Tax=Streptomyces sp. Tu 3180 TaxID=2682611 RepID=UPI00135A2414|nr:hypothetical protein [Streptomyces sp. Tu 3180]KAF3468352.1 hypothetical protein GL259_31415 [Streptomyces sp. Tu 3180]
MADDDFYTRDRPDDPALPEDRPRGGGPEDTSARGGILRGKPIWVIIALVALVVIFLALFMP